MCLLLAVMLAAPVPEKPNGGVVYHAYWLDEVTKEQTNGYQKLLVTTGPLVGLSERKLPPAKLALDHPALLFSTYGRDSLWADPFQCVSAVGKVDANGKTVVIGDKTYTFEEINISEVVRLLENPLGTKRGIHRRAHPLTGAEQTAKAFTRILKDQIEAKK
ncbi:unnamed protein product [Gemmata massiliana]|uniref:Uncharacterized protein n=1 Tax=Gemmata massiliana TaxID=1210884 RepID=A0A6P2D7Z7_9BACT|nr:hypothetical protein [Gemmata massiliana]VTR97279.1 unnamed protein product [Gemmata massiliana]